MSQPVSQPVKNLARRFSAHHAPGLALRDATGILGPDGKPMSETKATTITGYAAVFYNSADPTTQFMLWDDIAERIMPGAFTRALAEDDVRALFNHDACRVLGRSKAATLRLSVDQRGLRYEITPPDTEAGRELVEAIRRGDISGSSFSFIARSVTTRREDKLYVREINDCQLFDVGPVTFPAYEGTEAGIRSASLSERQAVRAELEAERGREAERDQLEVYLAALS